jgi:hypothetical protein
VNARKILVYIICGLNSDIAWQNEKLHALLKIHAKIIYFKDICQFNKFNLTILLISLRIIIVPL